MCVSAVAYVKVFDWAWWRLCTQSLAKSALTSKFSAEPQCQDVSLFLAGLFILHPLLNLQNAVHQWYNMIEETHHTRRKYTRTYECNHFAEYNCLSLPTLASTAWRQPYEHQYQSQAFSRTRACDWPNPYRYTCLRLRNPQGWVWADADSILERLNFFAKKMDQRNECRGGRPKF